MVVAGMNKIKVWEGWFVASCAPVSEGAAAPLIVD